MWLLLPEKEVPLLTAAGEVSPEAAAPAAAFRAAVSYTHLHGRGAASITRILVEEKVPTPGWLNY